MCWDFVIYLFLNIEQHSAFDYSVIDCTSKAALIATDVRKITGGTMELFLNEPFIDLIPARNEVLSLILNFYKHWIVVFS